MQQTEAQNVAPRTRQARQTQAREMQGPEIHAGWPQIASTILKKSALSATQALHSKVLAQEHKPETPAVTQKTLLNLDP